MLGHRYLKPTLLVFTVIMLIACGILPTPEAKPTSTHTSDTTHDIGSTMVNLVDGAVMVYVPEGEFLMGSEDGYSNEKPEHLVYLDAFWIYQHPVTNVQFAAFIDSTGHETTAEEMGWSYVFEDRGWVKRDGADWGAPEGPGSSLAGREDHPVVHVSWFDASVYCAWAGGRLLSEAEWEKAARGTDGRKHPWRESPVISYKVNYCDVNCPSSYPDTNWDDGFEKTSPVGSYPLGASPYGALDMVGNVWEWVADWFGEDYYSRSPYENPAGPDNGAYRVMRGSSWLTEVRYLRVSIRNGDDPGLSSGDIGFRCLRSP